MGEARNQQGQVQAEAGKLEFRKAREHQHSLLRGAPRNCSQCPLLHAQQAVRIFITDVNRLGMELHLKLLYLVLRDWLGRLTPVRRANFLAAQGTDFNEPC